MGTKLESKKLAKLDIRLVSDMHLRDNTIYSYNGPGNNGPGKTYTCRPSFFKIAERCLIQQELQGSLLLEEILDV